MNTKFKEQIISLFSSCAHAPTKSTFEDLYRQLVSKGGGRFKKFLDELPNDRWANAFFPGQRYGEMTSNLAECFNAWIEKERHLPVTQLIDSIRVKLMEQMSFRKETSSKWTQIICP